MATLVKTHNPGEFILSELPGEISRDVVTVTVPAATTLPAGSVLVAGPGGYVPVADGAPITDTIAILYGPVTNSDPLLPASVSAVVVNWGAVLDYGLLDWGAAEAAAIILAVAVFITQGLKLRNYVAPSPA